MEEGQRMIQINIGETNPRTGGQGQTKEKKEPEGKSESEPQLKPVVKGAGSLMTVAEMGRILGLKKTDRYWLIHKGLFETRIFLGKTWVVRDSFEKWYANQTHYHKVDGEAPGWELREQSYGARDIAGMLGLREATVYELIKREGLNTVVIDHTIRVPREVFEKWHAGQEHYRTKEDRNRDEKAERNSITMPEMARLLGLTRKQVYMILKGKRYKDIFEILVIAGRKRITRESFDRFLQVQDRYRLHEAEAEEEPAQENGEEKVSSDDEVPDDPDMRRQNHDSRQYIGISEAAEMIHVPEKLLYRWILEGTIPSRKVGRRVFLDRNDLNEWQENMDMAKNPGQEIFEQRIPEREVSEQRIKKHPEKA